MDKRSVNVKFLGEFRDIAGTEQMTVELDGGYTLRDLIDRLCRCAPKLKTLLLKPREEGLAPFSMILNGKEVYSLGDLSQIVPDGSEVTFFFWGVGG
jgi:molybdopterin converting factor small subunit